jgi:bacterioferritin-associated ferredoxin
LLKGLRLIACNDVSNEAFAEAIQKFPLLEELELSYCNHISDHGVLKLVAKACPHIEHLKYAKSIYNRMHQGGRTSNEEALAIARMHNLWSLDLSSDSMSNEVLTTILDNCPYLEYLNICGSLINMDDILRAKCAQISMNDYEHFQRSNPVRCRYPYTF